MPGAKNFEDVAELHQEERGGRTTLRIVLPNDLQQRSSNQFNAVQTLHYSQLLIIS